MIVVKKVSILSISATEFKNKDFPNKNILIFA